ncbi:hypothetical protein CWB72_10545 [Pseudoalteromonas phenolica]|uniref:hypothetical protein n=1 Tax=Pseudoalteromonas phenolica TaxID=161398 RepID=UPI00110AC627|nr:hypothetical protein [Pseudoalteromonas phenolica]TMN89467.1 hypothetical protein CWB72_10545 [Pseudoalteromonas phenolica]
MTCNYDKKQGMCIDGNFHLVHPYTCEPWTAQSVASFVKEYASQQEVVLKERVESEKCRLVELVKQRTFQKLTSEYWRVERAQEHLMMAELGQDNSVIEKARSQLNSVLTKRQAWREASDIAEVALQSTNTLESLENFSFDLD